MSNEPTKVKDGSQPVKIIIGIIALVWAVWFAHFVMVPWMGSMLFFAELAATQ